MFPYPEVARNLETQLELPIPGATLDGAAIDTRTLETGELFVALTGESRDGHAFLDEAFVRGASGALISKAFWESRRQTPGHWRNLLPVEDPLAALTALARFIRGSRDLPVVGITGSVGKSTTKEFLAYLLRKQCSVLSTRGNFNNHLGLPITLCGLSRRHEVCVAELGASAPGEILNLARTLLPTAAILTNISPAHLEGFGSLDAVYDAKLELLHGLPEGAPVVLPSGDRKLIEKAGNFPVRLITVGREATADYCLEGIELKEGQRVAFRLKGHSFELPVQAPFLAENAAMALALAEQLGLALETQPSFWEDLNLLSGRFEIASVGGMKVIFDGYNANPRSFEEALNAFCALPCSGRRVLVMADMLELGEDSPKYHAALADFIAARPIEHVLAYGSESVRALARLESLKGSGVRTDFFQNGQETGRALADLVKPGDVVLLKASRGMRMETVYDVLRDGAASSQRPGN